MSNNKKYSVIPKNKDKHENGDIRWNDEKDIAQIYDGSKWKYLISADKLKEIYGNKSDLPEPSKDRFVLLAMDIKVIEDKHLIEYRKTMISMTEKIITEALSDMYKNTRKF